MSENNVLNLRNPALFSPKLRARIETSVPCDNKKEVVESVEQAICTHIVSVVREFLIGLACKAGTKLGRSINGR
jgi:hypothetical protein